MSLVEFLTSKEIIIVYAIAAVAILLCLIIYIVEKNKVKSLRRHNTKELNKLVEELKDEVEVEKVEHITETPTIIGTNEIEKEDPQIVEDTNFIVPLEIEEEKITTNELDYIENTPSIEEAKEELKKITLELEKNEQESIDINTYEQEQEENAIISLEELVKKGKEIYENNELREYSDDGNEPISLHELEMQVGKTAANITDTFIIENAVSEEELIEENPTIIQTEVITEEKKFKSTPFISPIYGIEKEITPSEIELENTADYDKLDSEIKKTNEFLMTLKELQKKLD